MNITVPVIVHLDHGLSVNGCKKAVDAGYDSVMFDGSKLSIAENINLSREVAEYAHSKNVYVEGEVGAVGGNEDGMANSLKYASLQDCVSLVRGSYIDTLAPALGSVHGEYVGEPDLDFDKMKKINDILNIPLVLHGASGLSDEDVQKAINFGHAKINFNTEINLAWSSSIREFLTEHPKAFSPQEIINPSIDVIKETVTSIIKKCSSDFKSTVNS
jgi:6-phospho-5-dehydro-2-deoxy-D-gluconate aldolase